jgi:hypothetical protein
MQMRKLMRPEIRGQLEQENTQEMNIVENRRVNGQNYDQAVNDSSLTYSASAARK